jgi:hypothetical protein
MSSRLTTFGSLGPPVAPKSKLDTLATAAGLDPFPAAPAGYADATIWDPTKADYAADDIVLGPAGDYYRCLTTPPAGTWLSHPTYWTPATPDWVGYMNTVRAAAEARFWTASGRLVGGFGSAGNCADRVATVQSCVLSGPWEVPEGAFATGGLNVTIPISMLDSAGRYVDVYAHGFKDLILYSERSDCRLDYTATWTPAVFAGAGDPSALRFKATVSGGRVSGTIAYNATGSATPTYDSRAVWDAGLRLLTWTWSDELITDITIEAEIAGGSWEQVSASLTIVWPGQTAETATSVISSLDVYLARAAETLPGVVLTQYYLDGGGAVAHYTYADGANAIGMLAVPVNYTTSGSQWRLRARTLPVSDVRYADLPLLTTDVDWQRQWYVCQRASDTRVITPTTAQVAIREIDTVFAKRNLAVVDQTKPILDRTSARADRGAVGADVGFLRVGDPGLIRLFPAAAVAIIGTQMVYEAYLGRENAILVWDNTVEAPLPLRWTGDDGGILLSATGPLTAWMPNASQDWGWTGGGSWSTTPLGYYQAAAAHLDDLLAILALV